LKRQIITLLLLLVKNILKKLHLKVQEKH